MPSRVLGVLVCALLLSRAAASTSMQQGGTPPAPAPEVQPPKPAPDGVEPKPAPQGTEKPKPEGPPGDAQKSKDDAPKPQSDPQKSNVPPADGQKPPADVPQKSPQPPSEAPKSQGETPGPSGGTPKPDAATQKSELETSTAKLGTEGAPQVEKPAADAASIAARVVAREEPPEPAESRVSSQLDAALTGPSEHAAASSALPLRFDATRAMDASGYSVLVERLALEYPDFVRVQSLGRSRTGRDLWLLTASDMRTGDPSLKPALCVCSDLPWLASPIVPTPTSADTSSAADAAPTIDASSAAVASPEAALFLIARLLSESRTSPALATLLQESTLYVMPAIDPERTVPVHPNATDGPPRACHVDRNFPVDWQPWGDAPGAQGPYPLSEAESQSIASFVALRANVSAVLLLTRDVRRVSGPSVKGDASASEVLDEQSCQRVCALVSSATSGSNGGSPANGGTAATILHSPAEIARHGGDFTSFCEEFAGLSVFANSPWHGAPLETPLGLAPAGFESAANVVEKMLTALPRLATDVPKVERLRNNLWMVDTGVHNRGIMPTMCARLRARGATSSVSLKVVGAKLMAVGLRRGSESSYEALRPYDGGAEIGQLAGLESINLRILVEAPENTALELSFESLRAGQRRVKVTLQ